VNVAVCPASPSDLLAAVVIVGTTVQGSRSIRRRLVTVPSVVVPTREQVDPLSEVVFPAWVVTRSRTPAYSAFLSATGSSALAAPLSTTAQLRLLSLSQPSGSLGLVVIFVNTGSGVTVSVSAELVTVPAVLLTTTANVDPLSRS